MEQTFKIFVIQNEPYLTINEDVKVGDKAIVTVGELYPTLVECINEDQINLFQKPKTSMTKRHKVVMMGEDLVLENEILSLLSEKEGPLTVTYENGNMKVVTEM
jgi:hypothetical protein